MSETDFAKARLRDYLGSLIVSPISDGFWSIQASAIDLCTRNRTPDQVIRTFQNMLTKIPDWSDVTLSTEVDRIQKVSKCSYLDDLIMGVFISYMKSFASLHHTDGSPEVEIDFERPTLAKFIHEVYVQSARKLWQVAYLFKTTGVSDEVQARARQEIENNINQCIEVVIRSFLPWESIAKKYFAMSSPEPAPKKQEEVPEEKKNVTFGDDEEEEESESEEEEEERPPQLNISEEDAELKIDGEEEEEVDPMKELEQKVSETLVLNL
jgi:hypothetical protein